MYAWVCNEAPLPASPLCPLGVQGGIAFSSFWLLLLLLRDREERDRSARDTLRDFFLPAAAVAVAAEVCFAGASWSPNENMTPALDTPHTAAMGGVCGLLSSASPLRAGVGLGLGVAEMTGKWPLEIAGGADWFRHPPWSLHFFLAAPLSCTKTQPQSKNRRTSEIDLGVESHEGRPGMDLYGHRSRRSGSFLLSLLVLLGSAQATPPHAATRASAAASSAAAAAFAANGHTTGGGARVVLGRTRARRGSQHRCPHQHLSWSASDSESPRRRGRTGRHELRPTSSSNHGRNCIIMSGAVDEQQQRPAHEAGQLEGRGRHPEGERGGLSRASFVRAAAGSTAAVLALSLVSYATCTYLLRRSRKKMHTNLLKYTQECNLHFEGVQAYRVLAGLIQKADLD